MFLLLLIILLLLLLTIQFLKISFASQTTHLLASSIHNAASCLRICTFKQGSQSHWVALCIAIVNASVMESQASYMPGKAAFLHNNSYCQKRERSVNEREQIERSPLIMEKSISNVVCELDVKMRKVFVYFSLIFMIIEKKEHKRTICCALGRTWNLTL